MFTAYREYFIHGKESDPTDLTVKWFDTEEKANAYIDRYAKGIRFCSAWVESEDGATLYEILNCGARRFYNGKEL